MIKIKRKSKDGKLKFQDKKDKKNRALIIGSIIATIIAISPYIFTLWESVPAVKVWDTFLFTYDSKYYEDVQVLAWTLINKLIPLLLLLIWFLTNRHWWYHAILVPMAMYIYQIIIILNDDLTFTDGNEIIYLLPVMVITIPTIYLVRAKIFNSINQAEKSMQELEDELKIKPKSLLQKFKEYF